MLYAVAKCVKRGSPRKWLVKLNHQINFYMIWSSYHWNVCTTSAFLFEMISFKIKDYHHQMTLQIWQATTTNTSAWTRTQRRMSTWCWPMIFCTLWARKWSLWLRTYPECRPWADQWQKVNFLRLILYTVPGSLILRVWLKMVYWITSFFGE